ncbi:MAG: hypothetical protein Q7J67_05855 [bacterium]|nr:hypothetical protein [bacterium]
MKEKYKYKSFKDMAIWQTAPQPTESQSHLEYAKRVGYINIESAKKLDKKLSQLYNDLNKVVLTLRGSV